MLIIDREKINQEIQWLDESTIIFQNKIFTRGFDISPNAYQKSLKLCSCEISEEFRPLYLVLENPHYLTVWIEQQGVSLTDEASASPINSPQPEGRVTDTLDGEPTTNHNQLPVSDLPDSLSKSETSSETPIITQNPGDWHNSTESDSPATPKVPTGNLDQEKVVSETAVSDQNNTLLAEVGNREQGTGNSGEDLTQTLSENYFCKEKVVSETAVSDQNNTLLAEVGNREQGTGNSGEDLTQTLSENYFCKSSNTPKAEGDLNPSGQQITKQSGKRVFKKKYRGIVYEVEAMLIQLPESELTTDDKGFVRKKSKKRYRGISY
ncbi:hypothetical protein [Moorena bouillonii]|uniref:Uncharacterized protein n=1 Tax=Moorena bouillonii PNG TaxID=568701 RepID=A0A1U7N517_9CYAN|nr:hypothetical protein [Moorena bouillonii]OLT61038.1 hypothetical protein BJP37_20485 [Moorena bouillonii PNG]